MSDPPAGFEYRPLVIASLGTGSEWQRLYRSRFPDPLGWKHGFSRFSDPSGSLFGVVYLGSSLKVCFVETILRDRADGTLDSFPVATTELTLWTCAYIVIRGTLNVIDLRGDAPLRMGIPSDVVGAKDQTVSRKWSQAFWRHSANVDGVLYPSRLNEERNLAVFDRALGKLALRTSVPLLRAGFRLVQVLNDLQVELV